MNARDPMNDAIISQEPALFKVFALLEKRVHSYGKAAITAP